MILTNICIFSKGKGLDALNYSHLTSSRFEEGSFNPWIFLILNNTLRNLILLVLRDLTYNRKITQFACL